MALSNNKPLHIALLAGEKSGDLLGAPLIEALRERLPDVRFSGVGGAHMQAAGLDSLLDMRRLSVMGLVEVLHHLPDLLAAKKSLLAHWAQDKPDIFIGIDAPDFNLRIAKALHEQGVHTVQYVSPSLWAWKEKRIHTIQAAIDQVLCLFPFETSVYERHGVDAVCVGHPLRDRLRPQGQEEARRKCGINVGNNALLRQCFDKRILEELKRHQRHNNELCLLLLDIDYFKQINDEYGHQAGDMVLREMGRILLSVLRQSDFPARYGGEEFAVILPQTTEKQAWALAERIRKKIAATSFRYGGVTFRITVSIGITAMSPGSLVPPKVLIEEADQALYQAKTGGRNMVCCSAKEEEEFVEG